MNGMLLLACAKILMVLDADTIHDGKPGCAKFNDITMLPIFP